MWAVTCSPTHLPTVHAACMSHDQLYLWAAEAGLSVGTRLRVSGSRHGIYQPLSTHPACEMSPDRSHLMHKDSDYIRYRN